MLCFCWVKFFLDFCSSQTAVGEYLCIRRVYNWEWLKFAFRVGTYSNCSGILQNPIQLLKPYAAKDGPHVILHMISQSLKLTTPACRCWCHRYVCLVFCLTLTLLILGYQFVKHNTVLIHAHLGYDSVDESLLALLYTSVPYLGFSVCQYN